MALRSPIVSGRTWFWTTKPYIIDPAMPRFCSRSRSPSIAGRQNVRASGVPQAGAAISPTALVPGSSVVTDGGLRGFPEYHKASPREPSETARQVEATFHRCVTARSRYLSAMLKSGWQTPFAVLVQRTMDCVLPSMVLVMSGI